jgi:hypothetical protein
MQGTSSVDVYWRDGDGGLDEAWYEGSSWYGPGEVAGTAGSLASAPTALQETSSVDVFWRGNDGGLDEAWYEGSSWHGPGEVPGTAGSLTSAPSAEQDGSALDVYWRGGDGGVDEESFDGTAWHGPTEIPGTAPATTPTAPVTVALPVPSATPPASPGIPHKPGHVRARFAISWRWSGTRTRLVAMHVRGVPSRGSISIACSGRGCPWHRKAAPERTIRRLLRSLAGRVLSAGDRLTFAVRAPNLITERIEVRIRNGVRPTARLL